MTTSNKPTYLVHLLSDKVSVDHLRLNFAAFKDFTAVHGFLYDSEGAMYAHTVDRGLEPSVVYSDFIKDIPSPYSIGEDPFELVKNFWSRFPRLLLEYSLMINSKGVKSAMMVIRGGMDHPVLILGKATSRTDSDSNLQKQSAFNALFLMKHRPMYLWQLLF